MALLNEQRRRRLKERLRAFVIAAPRLDADTPLPDLLLDCPACGEEPVVDVWSGRVFGGAFVRCLLCGHSGPEGRSLFDAIDAWNIEAREAGRRPRDRVASNAPAENA